jgi:hypothetical protein
MMILRVACEVCGQDLTWLVMKAIYGREYADRYIAVLDEIGK